MLLSKILKDHKKHISPVFKGVHRYCKDKYPYQKINLNYFSELDKIEPLSRPDFNIWFRKNLKYDTQICVILMPSATQIIFKHGYSRGLYNSIVIDANNSVEINCAPFSKLKVNFRNNIGIYFSKDGLCRYARKVSPLKFKTFHNKSNRNNNIALAERMARIIISNSNYYKTMKDVAIRYIQKDDYQRSISILNILSKFDNRLFWSYGSGWTFEHKIEKFEKTSLTRLTLVREEAQIIAKKFLEDFEKVAYGNLITKLYS